jgi:large subunit ribosomal protein L18
MINIVKTKRRRALKAKRRSRGGLKSGPDRPRLVVYRSRKYLYAQVIDDLNNRVLMSLSSISKDMKENKLGKNIESARVIGRELGARLKAKKIESVCFDRNGIKYHGKIKALAEACRAEGIKF